MAAAAPSRTAMTVDGQVTTYTYAPDSNRLAAVDDGTGPVSFEYAAAGNTLTDGRRTFSYDTKNRMTAADGHAYGYNALGQRAFKPRFQTAAPGDADGDGVIDENDLKSLRDMIKGTNPASPGADCNGDGAIDNQDTSCIARQIGAAKNQGKGKNSEPETATVTATATGDGDFTQAGWILFAYDEAGRLIGEYDETGEPIRRYVWLEDLPVAVISAEGIHYLHADHLNTPKVVTDPSGAIVWQADYQPFGQVTESGEFGLNLRFPGQYHDRETGLHQNWHREYAPDLGRYSQSDPIGLTGGLNPHLYAEENPAIFTDKNGLEPVSRGVTDRNLLPRFPFNFGNDLTPCSYYSAQYNKTQCRYYLVAQIICSTAHINPVFTRDPAATPDNLNCVRRCLVAEDKIAWGKQNQDCLKQKCLSDGTIDSYHLNCFSQCGLNPDNYPGVGRLNQ